MPPNVVLLVLDAARRDAFEPYGASPGSTPAIADLARRGAALPSAFSTGCWTIPSHASIFTGLLPRDAGLARAPEGHPHGCRPVLEGHRDRLLPEVLRRAGYSTAAVSTNLWLSEASGFDLGFDDFVSIDSGRQGRIHGGGLGARLRWQIEALRARADDGAREAESVMRGWLERGPRSPFFWFVNLVECHSPYLPPRPYGGVGPVGRVLAAREARRHLTLDAIWRACVGGFDISPAALDRMRELYRASILYLDHWVGRLLESLDDRGLLDETLVVVTSDHGENLGEGGLIAHALSLDNRLTHVPFVVAGPHGTAGDDLLSLAALPRVIAELAGVDGHPYRPEDLPGGAAVAQFDPPVGAGDARVGEAIERWGLGEEALARLTTPLTSATDGRLKLVREGDARDLLYDTQEDPLELSPQPVETGEANGAAVVRLRAALEHRARTVVPPEASGISSAASSEELVQLEERMRLLGYM